MSPVSHQTVRLSRGSHRSPEDGVCVMELTSMLAGERFSDQPKSACPVVAAFLRAYNDLVDSERRQDLYAYAAKAVGSRSPRRTARERARLCRELIGARRKPSRWLRIGPIRSPWAGHLAGVAAARSRDPGAHRQALAFVDRLLDIQPVPAAALPDSFDVGEHTPAPPC
ncbi:MAG: hypothetical protein WD993_00170 [Thermoleophilaceae bacterium]